MPSLLGTIPHYSTFPEDKWVDHIGMVSLIKFLKYSSCLTAMHGLFTKMQSPHHCLYPLLPSRKDHYITVRPRGSVISVVVF